MVGLTTYLEQVRTGIWDVPAAYLPADYFEGVIMAGGIAVLLPPQPVDPEIADRCPRQPGRAGDHRRL